MLKETSILSHRTREALIQERLLTAESNWKKSVEKRHFAMKETELIDGKFNHTHLRVFWDFFYPAFNCPHDTERIGRVGDGGKWVCGFNHLSKYNNDKKYPCVIYSFGISSEITFEKEILSRSNCTVRMYDMTIDLEKVPPVKSLVDKYWPQVSFEPVGLGPEDDPKSKLKSLQSLMEKNNDEFIDILKVDIEGIEFYTFSEILKELSSKQASVSLPFGQLEMEFHYSSFPATSTENKLKEFVEWWEMLESAGLRSFHREANYAALFIGQKYFVEYFEFSFINIKSDHILLHA